MATKAGTVIVTGANGGLGKAIVAQFLADSNSAHYKGLWGVRDPSKATQLKEVLKELPNAAEHELSKIDLSSLASTRASAASINARVVSGELPPIRVLVLNAALQIVTHQSYTDDKLETTFAVNHLATFLLAVLLMESMDKENGRIVIVSSWTHDPSHLLNAHIVKEEHKTIYRGDLEPLARPAKDKEGDDYQAGMRRYGASKTLIIMIMYELQRRLSASKELSNISILAVDPGGMPGTQLIRDSSAVLQFFVHTLMGVITPMLTFLFPNGWFRTPAKSATDVLKASFDESKLSRHPKGMYLNGDAIIISSPETRDTGKQKKLWQQTVELAELSEGETVVKLD